MKRFYPLLGALLLLGSLPALGQGQEPARPPVQPREVRKIHADGKHNAFTALIRYREQLWLAFRSGKDHNSSDGDLVVLRSPDGRVWKEAFRLDAAPDDRDPQFLIVGSKLFLYDPAIRGGALATFAVFTEDGQSWSKPQPVYEPLYILWKPVAFQGKFYAAAHKRDNTSVGKKRDVHLIVSENGLGWKKISTIRAGNWESETTLHFAPNGHLTAFLRQKYGSPQAQVLEADPPYTEWRARPADVGHFSCHCVHTFRGVTYLISRTIDPKTRKTGTMIYTFADGKLRPYCELPAGGDCSYAEAVEVGNDMLVSYYSSHEGTTNIYLAVVPLESVKK